MLSIVVVHSRCPTVGGAAMVPESRPTVDLVLCPGRWGEVGRPVRGLLGYAE